MTYADRAATFLERTASGASSVPTGDERNERNEKSPCRFQLEHWARDPRSDLTGDSAVWARLLAHPYDRDGDQVNGLFGRLPGLRNCGAGLDRRQGRLRLVGGEIADAEYAVLRERYPVPHQAD